MTRHPRRGPTGRWLALLLAVAMLAAACGGADDDADADEAAGDTDDAADDTDDATGDDSADDDSADDETDEAAEETAGGEGALAGDGDIPDMDLSGQSIRITTSQPGGLTIGAYWMFEKLREWGAEVEEIVLTTTSGIQTLIAGESDAGAHGADEVVLGAAEGATAVAIGAPNSRLAYVLIGNEDVNALEDLEGATIAMSGPSGFDALLSRFVLEDQGLDPDSDANFLQIGGSGERAAALAAGSADAATVFLEDFFEIRQRDDSISIVSYMAEEYPEFPADVYFASTEFLEANPDMGTAMACANLEYNSWIADDEDGFVEYALSVAPAASEVGLRDTYEAAFEVDMFPTESGEVLNPDGMQALMDAMVENEEISQPVEIDSVIDTQYLDSAAEMGCGS